MDFGKGHTIYFLGIGGIGMSALARYFKHRGAVVVGYDRVATPLTTMLESEEMQIHYTDDPSFLPQTIDLVIYTPAIPADNNEFLTLKARGVTIKKRAEILGMLSETYYTIAIAGTHGKTTITAMTTHVLQAAGINLIGFIGGIANNFDNNLVFGDGEETVMVVEADEFDRSFLQLTPDIAVVSSVDADHLDVYGKQESVTEGFQLFVERLNDLGLLIYKNGLPLQTEHDSLTFGTDSKSDFYAENIHVENGKTIFTLCIPNKEKTVVKLPMAGTYNVLNALATAAVANEFDIKPNEIAQALETFKGVRRRFDIRVNSSNHSYIDDYAHHPEEIKAFLTAVREFYPDKKMTVVFQPHLFTRTHDFMNAFAESLSLADSLILLDIYPAREKPIEGISSKILLEKIELLEKQLCSKQELLNCVEKLKPELLITMGAGDIDCFVEPLEKMIAVW